MDDISILEELGLQEVSRKTHIETRFLQYMVNKDFSKLNRINTLGFVKILKREYNLDLKEWCDEFEVYWSEHGYKKDVTYEHSGSVFAPDQQEAPKSRKGLVFLIILILLGVGFYFLDGMSYVKQLQQKYLNRADNNTTYTKATVVEETQAQLQTIDEQNEQERAEEQTQEVIQDNNDNEESVQEEDSEEVAQDKNDSVLIIRQNTITTSDTFDGNRSNIKVQDENVEENSTKDEKAEDKNSTIADEASLAPRRKIWVGVVDLDSKKRKQYLTKSSIKIDLNKPQIIITGHGDFTLDEGNGKTQTYKSKKKKYYYVDGGTITQIDKKEFISYNGGKPW